jgi:hypothetical protein
LVVLGMTASAPRAADAQALPITPIVDCLQLNTATGTYWVYFGYVNTGSPATIEFGSQNQVIPGFGFQGQPTVFNTGSYPRVFRAVFNQSVFSAIAWDLNGIQAIATTASPQCSLGATGPASDLTQTSATLHGLVDPMGVDTAYYFNYGTTMLYGQATPERHTASASAVPVSEAIAGLMPGTTYHYQLVASGSTSVAGDDGTFTTDPLPPVSTPPTTQLPPADSAKPTKSKRCKKAKKGRKHKGKRCKRK